MDISINSIKLSEAEIQVKVMETETRACLRPVETAAFSLGMRTAQTMILKKVLDEQERQFNAKCNA